MAKSHTNAGNAKLKGKFRIFLSCRCCDVTDLRRVIRERIAVKELRAVKR